MHDGVSDPDGGVLAAQLSVLTSSSSAKAASESTGVFSTSHLQGARRRMRAMHTYWPR